VIHGKLLVSFKYTLGSVFSRNSVRHGSCAIIGQSLSFYEFRGQHKWRSGSSFFDTLSDINVYVYVDSKTAILLL
jgi:hypothetical protein